MHRFGSCDGGFSASGVWEEGYFNHTNQLPLSGPCFLLPPHHYVPSSHMHTHTHPHMHTPTHAHTHPHAHSRTHAHPHPPTHAHMYTHTHLPSGALITNLVSRNLEMKNAVLKRLCDMFPQVIGIPVPSDVNEVMVAMVMPREDISQLASPDSPLKLLSSPAVKASFQSLVDTISGVDGGRSPIMRDHWETSLNHAVLL